MAFLTDRHGKSGRAIKIAMAFHRKPRRHARLDARRVMGFPRFGSQPGPRGKSPTRPSAATTGETARRIATLVKTDSERLGTSPEGCSGSWLTATPPAGPVQWVDALPAWDGHFPGSDDEATDPTRPVGMVHRRGTGWSRPRAAPAMKGTPVPELTPRRGPSGHAERRPEGGGKTGSRIGPVISKNSGQRTCRNMLPCGNLSIAQARTPSRPRPPAVSHGGEKVALEASGFGGFPMCLTWLNLWQPPGPTTCPEMDKTSLISGGLGVLCLQTLLVSGFMEVALT
jgi:hypothetical protein